MLKSTDIDICNTWMRGYFSLILGPNNGNGTSTPSVNPSKGCHFFPRQTNTFSDQFAWICHRIFHRMRNWLWCWWGGENLVIDIFEGCFPFNSSRLHQLKGVSNFLPLTLFVIPWEKEQKGTKRTCKWTIITFENKLRWIRCGIQRIGSF